LYGWSIAKRSDKAVVVAYDDNVKALFTDAQKCDSVLNAASRAEFRPTGGTRTWQCTQAVWAGHGPFDRIVILTDEQAHDTDTGITAPVVTWNLAGYDTAHAAHGRHNRFAVGGYSDTVLECLPAVIGLGEGHWPWSGNSEASTSGEPQREQPFQTIA
jgi:hypothetical protein